MSRAQKIWVQLGGTPNLFADFPGKPKAMHWTTYMRVRTSALAAEEHLFTVQLDRFPKWPKNGEGVAV